MSEGNFPMSFPFAHCWNRRCKNRERECARKRGGNGGRAQNEKKK